MERRDFLKVSALAAAVGFCPGALTAEERNGMPYRVLGRTGEQVSLLGVGGAHVGFPNIDEATAIKLMRTAVDEGVNFFDNAWHYFEGESERRMGKALKDGYRDKVFLMTKHHGRDAKTAQEHLEESLSRLDVDMIDLWQFHEVIEPGDPEKIFNNGAIEFALKAKEEGKIRYIGFTGHHITTPFIEMLNHDFPWDTVQMPISIFDYHFRSFGQNVLPLAQEKNVAVIAMKTQGGAPGHIPNTGVATSAECLRYAMSQPVAVVVSGMDSLDHLTENLKVAKEFTPMPAEEMTALLERAKEAGSSGKHEPHKSAWHKDIQEEMKQRGLDIG